jgi:hypothetical protein
MTKEESLVILLEMVYLVICAAIIAWVWYKVKD